MKSPLVSVEYLKKHLDDKQLVLLDASPKSTIGGRKSPFPDRHIPLSRIFNLKEDFTNKNSPFPNTVPTPIQFQEACKKLGINQDSNIVIYDNLGIYTSPRAWWLFKLMGHKNVAVLDGGLPEWINTGNEFVPPIDGSNTNFSTGDFKAHFQKHLIKNYPEILANCGSKSFQIIDARSEGRFNGTAPEPRKNLKSGCIPHSVNIPYQSLLEKSKYKSVARLKSLFEEQIIGSSEDLVFSCGSGLTACIVLLAHELVFKSNTAIYDGSWTEWAEKQALKKE